MQRWIAGGVLGVLVATLAYWRRALTLDGAAAAAALGTVTFSTGGLPAAGALLSFFVSSSALSRVGPARKDALPIVQAKGSRRDAWQVAANGGVAGVCLLLGKPVGLVGALAAAAADTWATELGVLAARPPRLITTLRTVPAGTSGGVSLVGLLASGGGALMVAFGYVALGGERGAVRAAMVGGVTGSLLDSILGATLQATYLCPTCDVACESPLHARCGTRTQLVRGPAWVTNDVVNAAATLSGAVAALLSTHWRGGGDG